MGGSAEDDKDRPSKWDIISQEADRFSKALGIPYTVVRSVINKHGPGAPALTLRELLERFGNVEIEGDLDHREQLHQLSLDFGKEVEVEHLDRLLRMCSDKDELFKLAEILQLRSSPMIALSPNKPISLKLESFASGSQTPQVGENWTVVGNSLRAPPRSPWQSGQRPLDSFAAANVAGAYQAARNEAFEKSRAAYRKSKSDKLMGGVAAYYSDMGKDYDVKTKEYGNMAAESLVAEQSTDDTLDLHGVTVPQAQKIARLETTQWWSRVKEDNHGRGIKPYRIITGKGRHSERGESKILPAVFKMLKRENWNIQAIGGHILVYGAKK